MNPRATYARETAHNALRYSLFVIRTSLISRQHGATCITIWGSSSLSTQCDWWFNKPKIQRSQFSFSKASPLFIYLRWVRWICTDFIQHEAELVITFRSAGNGWLSLRTNRWSAMLLLLGFGTNTIRRTVSGEWENLSPLWAQFIWSCMPEYDSSPCLLWLQLVFCYGASGRTH